jgi:hypothetical protein
MYRTVHPTDQQKLPFRMLYEPANTGVFLRACEADSFRALVAALLDDDGYERASVGRRLLLRLRLAHDVCLLAELRGVALQVSDRDAPATISVASDEPFLHSLERLGFVSLSAPGVNR